MLSQRSEGLKEGSVEGADVGCSLPLNNLRTWARSSLRALSLFHLFHAAVAVGFGVGDDGGDGE